MVKLSRKVALAALLLAALPTGASAKATPRPTAPQGELPIAEEEKALLKPRQKTAPAPKPNPRNFRLLSEGELPLAARGAIVIDGFTGRTLYEKNADAPQYPASTTKVMTALLVIEAGNLDQEVEITAEDAAVGESSLNIQPGERFSRRQMLYGLMLKSANDVAHALGRDNAGTMPAFALKMTLRAQELGATATSFRNPHGLHHLEHYTSPRDLAMISRAAMQQPLFRQIVSARDHPWVRNSSIAQLRNHNRLLLQFPGCTGVKTGYTRPAQQVLASAALRGDREVVAVVMHTDKPGIWEDSKLLLSYGLEHPPQSRPSEKVSTPPRDPRER